MKRAVLVILLWAVVVFIVAADEPSISLADGVAWLLTGGGAGIVAYFLIGKVSFLKNLAPDYKRYASIGIVILLAGAGWGFGMLMGYMSVPETWRMWIEVGFSTAFVALTTSLILHGNIDLKRKRLEEESQ